MRIVEKLHGGEHGESPAKMRRRFTAGDESSPDTSFKPGALVCLAVGSSGLLAACQGSSNRWELKTQSRPAQFSPIPAEALFMVLRRGSNVGFQCLGAEGRLIQACEASGAPHALSHGFGSREAWEPTSRGSSYSLLNAQYHSKELGARVQRVSALPLADLALWEETMDLRNSNALARMETKVEAAAGSERRAAELIKAGQRAAASSIRDLDDLRGRLEVSNRAALRWKEEAEQTAVALQQAEAALNALWHKEGASPAMSADQSLVDILKSQIAVLQRELDAARGYSNAGGSYEAQQQDEVAAIRAEAAAAIEDLEAVHALEVEALLEERARLDSALATIKEMMGRTWGLGGSRVASEETENGMEDAVLEDEHPAVGVPVEDSLQPSSSPLSPSTHRQAPEFVRALRCCASEVPEWSNGSFSLAPFRPASASEASGPPSVPRTLAGPAAAAVDTPASSVPPPPSISPAPADHAVFDAGIRARVSRYYDMVNPLRPNSRSTQASTPWRERERPSVADDSLFRFGREGEPAAAANGYSDSSNSNSEKFASPENNAVCEFTPRTGLSAQEQAALLSPASRHRVALAGGACGLVDYQGSHPEALTEASMQRMLDGPLPSAADQGERSHKGDRSSLAPLPRPPSPPQKKKTAGSPLPSSVTKAVPAISCSSPWLAKCLAMGGSSSRLGSPPRSERRAVRFEADAAGEGHMATSAALARLGGSSPTDANIMVQYMADQMSVRASMQAMAAGKSRKASSEEKNAKGGAKEKKIAAVRRSASGIFVSKRSSFLARPLVAEKDLFNA